MDLNQYTFIVCDEFHYFYNDSQFNTKTDLSLKTILEHTNCIRIFMSATGFEMIKFLNDIKHIKTIDYNLPKNYKFIKSLAFYKKPETLDYLVKNVLKEKSKAIFFIDSAEKAYNLYKKYNKYCLFNCSKSNVNNYHKYVDEDKIKTLLKDESLDNLPESIIITTTCMDSGINIHDKNIRYIICDNIRDINEVIQCIGRKRQIGEDDKIWLAISDISNKQLGGIYVQQKKRIEKAEYLLQHNTQGYVSKYYKDQDKSLIVYDEISEKNHWDECTKKVNMLMYYKTLDDLDTINIIKYKAGSYKQFILDLFDYKDLYVELDKESVNKNMELEAYLDSIKGQKLDKEQQKELIDKIDLRVDGKRQKSYTKLNTGLEMIHLPFVIIPKRDNSHRYWTVEKIES